MTSSDTPTDPTGPADRRLFFEKRHACYPVVGVIRRASLAVGVRWLLLFNMKVTRMQKPFSFAPLFVRMPGALKVNRVVGQDGVGKVTAPEQRVTAPSLCG